MSATGGGTDRSEDPSPHPSPHGNFADSVTDAGSPATTCNSVPSSCAPDDDSFGSMVSEPHSFDDGELPALPLRGKYHRHISRSALMRDSVHALPSIQNLRLQFGGVKLEHRMGSGVGVRSFGALAEEEELPEAERRRHKPWKDVQLSRVAPEDARAEALRLSADMREKWRLSASSESAPSTPAPLPEDLRSLFVDTARAIRRVRALTFVLVPPAARRVSGSSSRNATFSTPSRPASGPTGRSVSGSKDRFVASLATSQPDPSAPVRRAALELLGHLRGLEEAWRVQQDPVPTVVVIPDSAADSSFSSSPPPIEWQHSGDTSSSSPRPYANRRLSSNSFVAPNSSTSSLSIEDIFSDDEEFNINAFAREAEQSHHEPWEDKLNSEAREYKITEASAAEGTRDSLRRWATIVEKAFNEALDSPRLAWISAAPGTPRTRAFITSNLTAEQAALVPSADEAFLERLADGYLLCQAFNSSVSSSTRPWGFISADDIHETLAEAEDAGREWTFRRVGNLTCWAAYLIPIHMTTSDVALTPPLLPDGAPIKPAPPKVFPKQRSASTTRAHSIEFDPLVVAKLGAGWSTLLRAVIEAWIDAAAAEVTGKQLAASEAGTGSIAPSSVAPSEAQPTPDVVPSPLPEAAEPKPEPELEAEPKAEAEAEAKTADQDAAPEAAEPAPEVSEAAPEHAVERSLA